MERDFDSWNVKKKILDKNKRDLMRFVSANRLYVRESALSEDDFNGLKKSVAKLLGL